MFVAFENLAPSARVWVYQADHKLNDQEIKLINEKAQVFIEKWAAHGKDLEASYKIFHNQFLVIAVDEAFNQASGCSIDSSVHFVKSLENELSINFTDRTKVAFILNDEVFLESLQKIKGSVTEGRIKADTLTFNNLITKKQELEESWLIPAKDTWLKKYF